MQWKHSKGDVSYIGIVLFNIIHKKVDRVESSRCSMPGGTLQYPCKSACTRGDWEGAILLGTVAYHLIIHMQLLLRRHRTSGARKSRAKATL